MNHMKEVAQMLGVKMGEKFRLKESTDVVYHFEKAGLRDGIGSICMTTLGYIISGAYHIEKFPWKPKMGDGYCWVDMEGSIIEDYWNGCFSDFARYYLGNCFETEEEAEACKQGIIDKMRRKYEGDGE